MLQQHPVDVRHIRVENTTNEKREKERENENSIRTTDFEKFTR